MLNLHHARQFHGARHFFTKAYHMVKRRHKQLKAALIAQGEREHWADLLAFLVLGIHSILKEDISCTPAELVCGTILRLPGDLLVAGTASPVDLPLMFTT